MQIKFWNLKYPEYAIKLAKRGKVHLLKRSIGDWVEYEAFAREPNCIVGKSNFWTDASGTTTETVYLGFLDIEVIDVPSFAS